MPNYIDNKEFFEELKKRKELEEETGEKQPISDYLGKCFLDISTNLAQKKNFANYTFIEEMIGDAIEQCIKYCDNFDPSLSTSPFSYFTQIVYYTFLRRIKKENSYNDFLSVLKETKQYNFDNNQTLASDFEDLRELKKIKRKSRGIIKKGVELFML